MRRHRHVSRKHPFAVFGLAALLTAPAALAHDGVAATSNLRTAPAAERASDRDGDRAVRTRPREQRAEAQRQAATQQQRAGQRAAQRRAAERAAEQQRAAQRRAAAERARAQQRGARQRATAGFPFLGGGRGVRLDNWPRTRYMDERELAHVLGRDTVRRLEADVRAQGLPTDLRGVWDDRDGRAKLDLSAGRIFIGRLIDYNRDGVFDEARVSDQFRNWRGRRR